MDQIYQLQQQIQKLRQEVNNISQMTSQLQQFEQNNATELQRLRQHEVNATQQLQRIQQNCQQLNNDLNNMNSTAQQISQSMGQSMGPNMGQNMYRPELGYAGGQSGYNQQFGTFGTQFTPGWSTGINPRWSSGVMGATGWGTGNIGTNWQTQPLKNINEPFQQQRLATGQWTGNYYTPMQSGYNQNQNFIQDYGNPSQDYSQSYAQNQQISQQAQQALDSRMNRATPNMFGQGNQMYF